MSGDVAIDGWLAALGFGLPASATAARATLEHAGLTRAGKLRISTEKVPKAEAVLLDSFALHCTSAECVAFAKAIGKTPLLCEPKSKCSRCGGSDNRRAETEFLEACRKAGARKIVVVGGSPNVRQELEKSLGTQVELRLVDGTERRTADRAKADLEWADLVLVWGGTELHHKVSMQYTTAPPELKRKVVHEIRRGVAGLLAAGVEHFRRLR